MSTTSARLLGGRYRLVRPLGHGGMAAVWAGTDIRLDRPVAVKVLDGAAVADPAMLQRLDREARTLAKLAHPNIVAVYDLATEDGVPYVVMELVDGDDLHQRLTSGPLDVATAVAIAAQVCDALEAAHDAGVVHRDIKPDNILLTASGLVKVCDFGIARLQQSSHSDSTGSATAVGTAMYMAPEQAAGGPVDPRTDLYALGCLLYAMLAGRPPFTGDDPMRVMRQQVREDPVSVGSLRPGIPRDLDELVAQLLAKRASDRPDSAAQVRARLAQVGGASGVARGILSASVVAAPMHGRAPVRPQTVAMPALEPVGQHRSPGRFRVGLAGIAAVAVGVAIVTALIIVALMSASPSGRQGSPAVGSSASLATPSPTSTTVDGVRAVIQAQALAGQLDADTANDLFNRLDEIDRDLARGRTEKAAEKVDELRGKLGDWADDDKITDAGYAAVLASLDQLASGLPKRAN